MGEFLYTDRSKKMSRYTLIEATIKMNDDDLYKFHRRHEPAPPALVYAIIYFIVLITMGAICVLFGMRRTHMTNHGLA